MRIDVWLPEETLVKAVGLPPDSRILSVEVVPAEDTSQHGSVQIRCDCPSLKLDLERSRGWIGSQ